MKSNVLFRSGTILVATDFSPVCDNAVSFGVKLASASGSKVCILHIINNKTRRGLKKKDTGPGFIDNKLKAYQDLYKETENVQVDTIQRMGGIYTTINETVKEIGANMMVLGTHGKKGWQYLLGSDIFKVVYESSVPTVVVQNLPMNETGKIVVPLLDDYDIDDKLQLINQMARIFAAQILFFRPNETDPELNNRLSVFINDLSVRLKNDQISNSISSADLKTSYQVALRSYASLQKASMIMIMVKHSLETPAINPADWYEELLFNPEQVPVMVINLTKF
jgi:nucleotide-binding universal stress UspA family protein